jgi:hypothetical protein
VQAPLNDIRGEAAYLRREAEILLNHISAVEGELSGVDDVNAHQARDLSGGPARMLNEAKLQLQHTIGCVDTWRQSISKALRAHSLR